MFCNVIYLRLMIDMNTDKLMQNFKIYCLDSNDNLVDNNLAVNYEINHNGVYIRLITIKEGHCLNCDEFDFYIVDNDFYNELYNYVIITPAEKINLPVGDDGELEYFNFGVKIKNNEIILGAEEYGEFEEFDNNHLFFSDNANLHEFLIGKMKKIMNVYG